MSDMPGDSHWGFCQGNPRAHMPPHTVVCLKQKQTPTDVRPMPDAMMSAGGNQSGQVAKRTFTIHFDFNIKKKT